MISASRDMFKVCAVALFCLVSASHSAPPACEDLVRPLDQLDPHQLEGKWALVAASLSEQVLQELFKNRNSSSITFSNASATSDFLYTISVDARGQCFSRSLNVSLEGSVLTFDVRENVSLTLTFIHTSCPDCLVMRYDDKSKKAQRLKLFSRRREVEQKEMEEFTAQVECLSLLPPAMMDPKKEFCPGQSVSDPAAAQTVEKQQA